MALSPRFMGLMVLLALLVSRPAFGQDKVIAVGNVPEKILNAAKEAFPGKYSKFLTAGIRTIDKKFVHYALEIKLKDKSTADAYIGEDGKVIRTGISVKPEDVPAVVRETFQKSYGEWTVTDLNKETDVETKAEYFNVEITKGGKTLELDFSPDGKLIHTLELKEDD